LFKIKLNKNNIREALIIFAAPYDSNPGKTFMQLVEDVIEKINKRNIEQRPTVKLQTK
jgi:hypothetical protein